MRLRLWVWVTVLCCPLWAKAQDFEAGLAAWNRSDYRGALQEWLPLAERGHTEAQYRLGNIYTLGLGVPKDALEGARWYRAAVSKGHQKASVGLALSLLEGEGIPENADSLEFLLNDENLVNDVREGMSLLRKAADKGDLGAAVWIGKVYAWDIFWIRALAVIEKDYREAFKWYQKAAAGGNLRGQLALGKLYFFGNGVSQDYGEAMKWFRKAASENHASDWIDTSPSVDAMTRIGQMYHQGLRVRVDYQEAAKWYSKAIKRAGAIEIDHAGIWWAEDARYGLGLLHERGRGVRQNYALAAQHYGRAKRPKAEFRLGRLHYYGLGVERDLTKAAKLFESAAMSGVVDAQYYWGRVNARGEGVAKNPDEAWVWLQDAAGQEHAGAQTELALMYEIGEFVDQDYSRAADWYRKAAEQGESFAQSKLGVFYSDGTAVPQDYGEAHRWFLKAAEQGDGTAQANLGVLYTNGQGVPQDFVKAHMWYNLAAASGFAEAFEARSRVAARMTPDEIARAQELARNWHARHETITDSPEGQTFGSSDWDLQLAGSGTGFVVAPPGLVLTNEHVIEGCRSVRTRIAARPRTLAAVTADESNDLALLELTGRSDLPTATFRAGRGPRAGETVLTLGYPLSGLLADSPTVTTGVLSALAGPGNDARLMQITAPIQQGSSGSPLLDASGNVIGIVVSKLDALRVASLTGDMPQNVNFAIKASVMQAFLEATGVEFRTAESTARLDTPALADLAKDYTVPIECWK